MKYFNKIISLVFASLMAIVFSSCAAGSATAGYAVKAHTADGLTADAENRIVERAKREVLAELSHGHPVSSANKI